MNVVIIPARGGSVEVPRKNAQPFYGRPLLAWTVDAAVEAKQINRIFVTTEDKGIARLAHDCGADVINRPLSLARDDTPLDPVIVHAIEQLDQVPDLVVTLQPTCPIRPAGLIDSCIDAFQKTGSDSLFTVYEGAHFAWSGVRNSVPALRRMRPLMSLMTDDGLSAGDRVNRQQMHDSQRVWLENGCIFITKGAELLRHKARICGTKLSYEMDRWHSVDINSMRDFHIAELLFEEFMKEERVAVEVGANINCHGS